MTTFKEVTLCKKCGLPNNIKFTEASIKNTVLLYGVEVPILCECKGENK